MTREHFAACLADPSVEIVVASQMRVRADASEVQGVIVQSWVIRFRVSDRSNVT